MISHSGTAILCSHTVGLVLSVLLVAGCGGGGDQAPSARPAVDRETPAHADAGARQIPDVQPVMAPDFELPRLEGGTLRLSDFRGSIVVLDFWATWCAPCRMSIPHLTRLHADMKDEGVVVIGVALDRDGAEVVEGFAEEFRIPYPIVLGTPEVVAAYGNFQSIPVSFLIDERGRIAEQFVGFRPRQVYETIIRAMKEESRTP